MKIFCPECSLRLKPYQDRWCSFCRHEVLKAERVPSDLTDLFLYTGEGGADRIEFGLRNSGDQPFQVFEWNLEDFGGHEPALRTAEGRKINKQVVSPGAEFQIEAIRPPAMSDGDPPIRGRLELLLSFRRLAWNLYLGPAPRLELTVNKQTRLLDEAVTELEPLTIDSGSVKIEGLLKVLGAPIAAKIELVDPPAGVHLQSKAEKSVLSSGKSFAFALLVEELEESTAPLLLEVTAPGLNPRKIEVELDQRGEAELKISPGAEELVAIPGARPSISFRVSALKPVPVSLGIPRIECEGGDWARINRQDWNGDEVDLQNQEAVGRVEIDLDRAPRSGGRIEFRIVIPYEDLERRVRSETSFSFFSREVREPELIEAVVFDFGTSNSTAAYYDSDEQESVLVELGQESEGGRYSRSQRLFGAESAAQGLSSLELPSVIHFVRHGNDEGHGRILEFGHQVAASKYGSLERMLATAWNFKRYLRDGASEYVIDGDEARDRWIGPRELAAMFLAEAKRRFELQTGKRVGSAVATYPAIMRHRARRLLKGAYLDAGFEAITFGANEPIALALGIIASEKFKDRWTERRFFAVFDFGGGTTDLTVASVEPLDDFRLGYRILRCSGDDQLCGEVITELIAQLLFERACEAAGVSAAFPKNRHEVARASPAARNNFYEYSLRADQIKHFAIHEMVRMEKDPEYTPPPSEYRYDRDVLGEPKLICGPWTVYLEDGGQASAELEVTLEDIRDRTGPEISRVLAHLSQLVYEVYVERGDEPEIVMSGPKIDLLVLGGNASRYPLVEELAREEFEDVELITPAKSPVDLKHAVVLGGVQLLVETERLINLEGEGELDQGDTLHAPLGWNRGGQFQELFPAGAELEEAEADERIRLAPVRPIAARIQFYTNLHHTEKPKIFKNPGVKQVGELDLRELTGETVSIESALIGEGRLRCQVHIHENQEPDSAIKETREHILELNI